MNKEEIDKWLDEEYGCSYTRLEELHDWLVDKDIKNKDEIKQLQQELTDYKERNDKAIEYIYKNSIPVDLLSNPPKPTLDFKGDMNELLLILKISENKVDELLKRANEILDKKDKE